MSLPKSRLLIFLVPFFLSLPFINRAYFVDDQFFIRIAHWIKDNPTRPYDFSLQDENASSLSQEQRLTAIVNPLLHHYYLALLMKVGGDREWFLRLGCMLLSCFSALLVFELARRWTLHPFVATLLVLLTPAFCVSAHSLLIDPTMNLFFLAALFTFIRSLESRSFRLAVLSGVFVGLALLTKYTAVLVVPLMGFWWIAGARDKKGLVYFFTASLIGGVMPAAFMAYTKWAYGATHLGASMAVTLHSISFAKLLVLSVFISGGVLAPFFVWGVLERKQFLLSVLSAALAVFVLASPWGGLTRGQSFFIGLSCVSFVLLIVVFVRSHRDWKAPGDRFLFFWAVSYIGMMSIVMPWVAVRYTLISVPAFVFLAVRLVEMRRPVKAPRIFRWGILAAFVISMSVAAADYWQAESARFIVKELKARGLSQGERRFFLAASYNMTYLKAEGWQPCFDSTPLLPGDRILVSEVTFPLPWFLKRGVPVKTIAEFEYTSRFPVKVMDSASGAAFYGSAWGPLPFSFSGGPWERFHLFEVINPVGNY